MAIRVTDSYLSSILVNDLNRSLGRMLEQQRMAGSMRRVNSYADDPRAVSSIQRYNSLISSNDEYLTNVTRSRLMVDGTDVALQNISDVLAEVRVIALRESSAIATDESMETSAIEVDNQINRLLDVLNTTIEGNYLFSGYKVGQPPFLRNGDTVIYQGDNNLIYSRTGPNSTMPVNIPGSTFMGTQSSFLHGGVDVAPSLDVTTALSDLSLGSGWTPGMISITDGVGNNWEIDLSSSLTVGDAITTINTATGGAVTASISPDGSSFQMAGTGPLSVGEVGDGSTASSLGLNATSGASLLTGHDIRPAADLATNLTDIEALSGGLPLGTMNVTWQGTDYTVDLSTAATLGDLQTIFNGAVPGMELQVEDSRLVLVGGVPEQFEVLDADATETATLLGLAGTGTPSRLFGMLEDLKADLVSGDKTAIRGVMTELKSIEDTVYQMMMKNGGRQNDLDWAEEILRQRDERLRSNLSLEQDADVAAVAAELSRAETSYQASLLVTSKLYTSNLMQYLR
jgi:flagellin-like hook-associated protein FlgL